MTITPLLSVRLGAVILAAMLGLSGCASGCKGTPDDAVLTETTLKQDFGSMGSTTVTLFSHEGTVVRMQGVSTMAYVGEMTAESAQELYEPALAEQNETPGVTVTMEFHKNEWVTTTTEDFTKMPECPTPDLKEMLKGQKDAGFVEVK